MNVKEKKHFEALRKKWFKIRKEIIEIEDKEKTKENHLLIGKCFKNKNSYGNSHPDWWYYIKIIGANNNNVLIGLTFQITSTGSVEVDKKEYYSKQHLADYTEIPVTEFLMEWNKVKDKINVDYDKEVYEW